MLLRYRVALRPNLTQARAFGRACGIARFAWNWGLARKLDALKLRSERNSENFCKIPTAMDLHKDLTVLKNLPVEAGGFPWMYEASKCAPQEALRDLDTAFLAFFRRLKRGDTPGHPRFKARGRAPGHVRFVGNLRVRNGRVYLPRIGRVRIMPGDRAHIPPGIYTSMALVEHHGRWFISVCANVSEASPDETRPIVGIDVGARDLAHLSDGMIIANPRALEREAVRLHKSKLAIARKQRASDKKFGMRVKGQRRIESRRLQRERRKAARLACRVANLRQDALHKATTIIAKKYSVVVVEDLSGKNMTRRRKGKGRAAKAGLNRAILNSGMLRIRPLLAYKMPLHGGRLIVVPAAYTSQTCSSCGARNNPGSSKTYSCAVCELVMDRDRNASLNILAAAGCSVASSQDGTSGSGRKTQGESQTAGCVDPSLERGERRA